MKKNLSKQVIKASAIGLAVTMGSSMAISSVYNEAVTVSAAYDSNTITAINEILNQYIKNEANFDTEIMKQGKYILAPGGLLFKTKDTSGTKAIFAGFAKYDNSVAINAEIDADGAKIPFKATFENGKLVAKKKDNSVTKEFIVEEVGLGAAALKTYNIKKDAAIAEENTPTEQCKEIKAADLNQILATGTTTIKNLTFDGIKIDTTNTVATVKLVLPNTVTHIEDKAFGGGENPNEMLTIEWELPSDLTNIAETTFDSTAADKFVEYTLSAVDSTEMKKLENKFSSKLNTGTAANGTNINLAERQAPELTNDDATYDSATKTITLTANEDLEAVTVNATDSVNAGFTIEKDGTGDTLTIEEIKVDSADATKILIKLSADSTTPDKDGAYKVKYAQPNDPNNQKINDIYKNALANLTQDKDVTIDNTSPAVESVTVDNTSGTQDAEKEVILTFTEDLSDDTANNLNDLKAGFSVSNDTTQATISSVEFDAGNKKEVKLVLDAPLKYGNSYKVSYNVASVTDPTKQLQDATGNKVDTFEKEIINRVLPAADDAIETTDYIFKVKTAAPDTNTDGEIQLIEKKQGTTKAAAGAPGTTPDPNAPVVALADGKVTVTYTAADGSEEVYTFNVTEAGDDANVVKGEFTKDELEKVFKNITTINTKAFEGATLKVVKPDQDGSMTPGTFAANYAGDTAPDAPQEPQGPTAPDANTILNLPNVTTVKVNGLAFANGVKEVRFLVEDEANVNSMNIDADAFKSSTTGQNGSVEIVKVPEKFESDVTGKLDGITTAQTVTAPAKDDLLNVGKVVIQVIDPADYYKGKIGTAKIVEVTDNPVATNKTFNALSSENGTLTGKISEDTFSYTITEIALTGGSDKVNDDFFKMNFDKVTTLGDNTFIGSTLPPNYEFKKVTKIGANAFGDVQGAETLSFPAISKAANVPNDAFGGEATTSTLKVVKLPIKIAIDKADALTNKNVKVLSTTPATVVSADKVKITGKIGTAITPTKVTLTLEGNQFLTDDLTSGKEVTWIANPQGLTAKVASTEVKPNEVTLEISGTPTKASSEPISLSIPETALVLKENIKQVLTNVTFDITSNSSSGGSSSGGGSSSTGSGSVSIGTSGTPVATPEAKPEAKPETNAGTDANQDASQDANMPEVQKELTIETIHLPAISETTEKFSDISENHWAGESIKKLSSAGIIKGLPNGNFDAKGNSKRADVAIMIVRLLGLEDNSSSATFSDVPAGAYYANAVGIAKEFGIITGNNKGEFKPNDFISRQDTMVIISRVLSKLGVETNSDTTVLAQFSDTASVSGYALEATAMLVNAGIINGNAGKINPKQAITRAEMAVIMDRIYSIIDKAVEENNNKVTETTTMEESSTESTSETTTSKDGSTETTTTKEGSTESTTAKTEGSTETTTSK